jgi:superfamily II DNA or RNA helicase
MMELPPAAGLYIAWGRWLDVEYGPGQLYKVGHTGNLGSRLNDSAYVTAFPANHWRYVATFEAGSKEEAFLLETAVLYCCRHRRLGTRELVRAPLTELVRVAEQAAQSLGISVIRRDSPAYALAARRASPGESSAAERREPDEAVPTGWPGKKACVESLTLSPLGEHPPLFLEPSDLSDGIDELLAMDFSAMALALPPAPAPAPAAHPAPAPAPAPVAGAAATPKPPSVAGEDMPIDEMDEADAIPDVGSPFDLAAAGPAPATQVVEAREYQAMATALCLRELRASGCAILQMACRCGKTPVAFSILREFLAGETDAPLCALYLVPGLSLLRQTAQKLALYGFTDPILLIGSDPRAVSLPGGRALAMTTDPAVVRAFVRERGRRLVISTYQSSPQVPTDAFALTVFDESHRVCGGKAPRPFNHFVSAPRVGARLFMTATPAYDPPSKTTISMKDRATFGGVAFRYHLRQGIAAGYVNDFRLEVVAAPTPAATPASAEAALPAQILAAMGVVDKLLVFCRDISHATRLCAAIKSATRPESVAPFGCLVAHSRMGPGGATAALRQFATPGERTVLCNVRLFQEGVEIPALNGVFFAAPRHSPRDIIQSLCRPLNRVPGKATSVVFLPVLYDPARPPEDPANLKRFASIVPFVDALLDEDPSLYEHLLDPVATPYPIDILGTHSLGLGGAEPGAAARRGALLGAVRRAVRYGASTAARPVERLLRVENVPWDRAFGEIRRIVTTCGRYPKTTDAWQVGEARVCLHRFYRWAADEYAAWRAGRPSKLEPHQVFDLQTLPSWELYGVEGPYPWRLCMDFLEQWLRDHKGVPPMCNINNGGYIGLEATAMERLSGALTCVNQADGKSRKGAAPGSGYTLNTEKQADLERICTPYGLRWKKEREVSGALKKDGPPTFIQESYARFKAYYKTHGADGEYIQQWYPGFPQKHLRMENLEVQKGELAPPRWRTGRRRRQTAAGSDGDDPDGSEA